jgi:Flp pilus assembly pilin Flp
MKKNIAGWRRSGMRVLRHQKGQAIVEYIVVVAFSIMVLMIASNSDPSSPIDQVIQAFKSFFGAYAHAISLSNTLNLP